MKYQVGDMLRVNFGPSQGDFFCIVTEVLPRNKFILTWIIEKGYIKNADPSWRLWGGEVLDKSFKRIT